ncbi:MAG: DUF2726 domain-containing protein [Kiritimatiellales bacterium]|nr:DUF2726 domain-containing protein [Kiritimatiellales bacterium]
MGIFPSHQARRNWKTGVPAACLLLYFTVLSSVRGEIGDTIDQSIARYGNPTGVMKSENQLTHIYTTSYGQITEIYDSKGICIQSNTRKQPNKPVPPTSRTTSQPAMSASPLHLFVPIILIGALIAAVGFFSTLCSLGEKPKRGRKKEGDFSGREAPKSDRKPSEYPTYEKQKYLLTKTELQFYRTLQVAIGEKYQIMCQVSLSQVIQTAPMSPKDRQTAFNKISRKVLDFVLCDPRNLSIVAAIELDDSSHNRNDRIYRDQELNEMLEDAGIPLIRFQSKVSYTTDQITHKLAPLKQRNAA